MFPVTAWRVIREVGYQWTMGAVRDRQRTKLFNGAVLSFRRQYAFQFLLPTEDVAALFPGVAQVSVVLERFQSRFANLKPAELLCIVSICKWLQPSLVLEIGTFDGNTTLQLALNSPAHCRLHTIALPPGQPEPADALLDWERTTFDEVKVGERFIGHETAGKITQHFGDSTRFDFAPFAGKTDLIFIDASHDYRYVMSDSRHALRCCSPRGVILWHDFTQGWPGVVQAVQELRSTCDIRLLHGTTLAVCRPHAGWPPK